MTIHLEMNCLELPCRPIQCWPVEGRMRRFPHCWTVYGFVQMVCDGYLDLTSTQLLAAESEPKVTGRSERFLQVHFLRFASDSNDLRAPESVS